MLLLVVLYQLGDPRALLRLFSSAAALPLALALLLNAPVIHLKVMRTQLLCELRGLRYGLRAGYRAMLPSLYLGMVTPGRVGDVLRVQYMRQDLGISRAEGLAIIVMDRFCDLYVLLGFVAAGVAHFATVLTGSLGAVTWLGVALTALAPLLFLVKGPIDMLVRAAQRRFDFLAGDGGDRFLAALRAQLRPKLLLALPNTVLAFMINYVQGWLVARAMGIRLDYTDVIFIMAIASLLSLLPISMSGLGVRELFVSLVFPALHYGKDQGVAFSLLLFVVIYVSCSVTGLIAWQVAPPPLALASEPPPPAATGLAAQPDPSDKANLE
jgi:uncharacterized membrane protein YbhN (UPF0104 family)